MGLCVSKKNKYYNIKYGDYNEPMNSDGQYDYLKYDNNSDNNYLIYDNEESLYYSLPSDLPTDEPTESYPRIYTL